jgi:hypothetical protein
MTRILQCGFETGDVNQEGSDTSDPAPITTAVSVVTGTPTPRSGTYCLKCASNSISGNTFSRKRFAHGVLTEIWYAFAIFPHPITEPPNTNVFFRAFNSEAWANLILVWDAGIIRAYAGNGAYAVSSIAGVLIGSSSSAYAIDIWHLIEIRYIPHPTNGTLQIYVDGALTINASGVRTSNTSATLVNINEFDVGFHRASTGGGTTSTYFAYDDIRVNSTAGSVNNGKPGDGKIIGLVPTGAGTYTQLTPSAGANWDCVNETPANTTDYVSHSTVGLKDTYAFSDPVTAGNISAVTEIAYAQNSDGGGGSIGLLVRSGGIDSEASPTSITAAWGYYKRIMEVDPADSAAWTTAKLAALEAGVVIR